MGNNVGTESFYESRGWKGGHHRDFVYFGKAEHIEAEFYL